MIRAIVTAVFFMLATPLAAQPLEPITALATSDGRTYQRCLDAVDKDPADAFEQAMAWRDTSGSLAAQHCIAAALLSLGQTMAAADRLERLGIAARAEPPVVRARVLAQAGQIWLQARNAERAHALLSAAIEVAPELPDLYVDRSVTLAAAQNYWEAIDDLNKALDLQPRYGVALAFRAAAYRYVDSIDLANEDAEEAVRVAPGLPEAWLERGILRRLRGDDKGARADWLRVLVLEPDGDAGDTARANIERLELRLDEKPATLPPKPSRRWNPF